jgi:uncharacterized protein YdaU (DUF1376 family)
MPFYIGDYLADTAHLTTREHGAYLLLIMAAWNAGGRLPKDPKILATIAKCDSRSWLEVGPKVLPFFHASRSAIIHKRIMAEILKATEAYENRCRAGKSAAERNNRARKSQVTCPQPQPQPNGKSLSQRKASTTVESLGAGGQTFSVIPGGRK